MMMTRRAVLLASAAAACAAAIPLAALPLPATAAPVAEMLFTTDEPWGMLVRGHVSKDAFDKAALALLDGDSDVRDNCEDWLFEEDTDEDGEDWTRVICAQPEHGYMRIDREEDPDLGTVFVRCKATEPGAIPITAVMY